MLSSWRHGCKPLHVLGVLVVFGVGLLLGCKDNITEQDEVFSDTAQRVEANVLPPVVAEAEAVLRNLVHLLAVLPEICATRLAELGMFESFIPALGAPDMRTFNNTDGRWEMTWSDRVLGDDNPPLTVDTATPRVDITLTIRFRSQGEQILRAVPFVLAPQTALPTAGEPPSCAAETPEGFFLSQNADSGLWTLRWCSLGTPKVFEGRIGESAVTRVIRRVADGANNAVTSLTVNETANEISFQETTAVTDQKGFTFFVRPGDTVRFRLRIGSSITREQLRIGGDDQLLPDHLNPADFILASSVPINPTGAPIFTPGTDLGSFIWQDVSNNTCNAGEDQWRMRFSKQASATTFSGIVRGRDENNQVKLRITTVGACPAGKLEDEERTFIYDCTLSDNTPSGYDICVTSGRRVDFTPEVNQVQDPGLVFVGALSEPPPSPDPFTILLDLGLTERQSSRNLRFSEGNVVLRGNDQTAGAVLLNPDQVSLEPLCGRLSAEVENIVGVVSEVQPRVRLTGGGDYATARFEGSAYILDNVEFTEDDFRRFPDRGDVRLQTRVEAEDTTVTTPLEEIIPLPNNQASTTVDVELRVNDVLFTFPNRSITLTVE